MIDEIFCGKLNKKDVLTIWPEFYEDIGKVQGLSMTNIKKANKALNIIMSYNEKKCLESALFGENGWYKKINGDGMICLKLAAMSLGLTNTIFTFDSVQEEKIKYFIKGYTKEQQIVMMKCYLRQKCISYITMKNYLNQYKPYLNNMVTLYRGINIPFKGEEYKFIGLESWTTSLRIAQHFAKEEGYVLKKQYPISQIWLSPRSTFKNTVESQYRNNGFYVRREHEIIVENHEIVYHLDKEKNVIFAMDQEIN